MTEKEIPNPGSDEAIDQGCRCPVLDNAHGEGIQRNGELFWYSADCPLHSIKIPDDGD